MAPDEAAVELSEGQLQPFFGMQTDAASKRGTERDVALAVQNPARGL